MVKVTLSKREHEVLAYLAAGFTQQEIGEKLGLSKSTISGYCQRAAAKLGARTYVQAVVRAVQTGQVSTKLDGLLSVRDAVKAEARKADARRRLIK